MDRKIFSPAAFGQIIVRKAARPHDFRHRIIIVSVRHHDSSVSDHRSEKAFRNLIRQFAAYSRNKISLQCMHHNICNACCKLIVRKCECKFRIHNCKFAPVIRGIDPAFFADLFIGQNRRITHLTSCCRYCQYSTYRERFFKRYFSDPDIPKRMIRICSSVGNCFCRINCTAPSYSNDHVYMFCNRLFDTCICMFQCRIGFCTAIFYIGDTCFGQ